MEEIRKGDYINNERKIASQLQDTKLIRKIKTEIQQSDCAEGHSFVGVLEFKKTTDQYDKNLI